MFFLFCFRRLCARPFVPVSPFYVCGFPCRSWWPTFCRPSFFSVEKSDDSEKKPTRGPPQLNIYEQSVGMHVVCVLFYFSSRKTHHHHPPASYTVLGSSSFLVCCTLLVVVSALWSRDCLGCLVEGSRYKKEDVCY